MDAIFTALFVTGIVFLIFLLSTASSVIQEQQTSQDGGATGSNTNGTKEREGDIHPNRLASAIDAYREQRNAHERDRAQREQTTIIVLSLTGAFALIAAGATIATVIVTHRDTRRIIHDTQTAAKQQHRDSARSLEAAQRPWISQAVNPDGPLVLIGDSRFMVKFDIKNWGHAPAKDVTAFVEFMLRVFPEEAIARQRAICKEMPSGAVLRNGVINKVQNGFIVYPGQSMPYRFGMPIFSGLISIWKAIDQHNLFNIGLKVIPTLVGCFTYIDSVTGIRHHTGILYEIDQRGESGQIIEANPHRDEIQEYEVLFGAAPFMTPDID